MYIEVEQGVRIFVRDLNPGEGSRPVVFVHGWPVNHRMFEYQFNVLPHYGYRCIGLDLRGFGKSDKPWHGYSYNRMADDIRGVIEALNLEDAVLIGFSIGGAISVRYMARHGGAHITRLALINAAAPLFTQRPDYSYGLPVRQVDELISQTSNNRPAMLTGLWDQFFNRNIGEPLVHWFHHLALEADSHATIECLLSLRNEDLRPDLRSVRVPCTVFYGVHDRIVPYPSAGVLQQGIAGSRIHPFHNSGHGLVVEEKEAFNTALLDFLHEDRPPVSG
ncbi:alpha/beta fold hydrolase [Paenibacillus tarimensis]|uniref:alpha/beta fold hydrolase n=1 Tax=Paenibacillus tarimensis TaxID=416012 RepID=UPI001F38CA83|nr:alpha/beta hydrolase [Paenibacillus tarimensis]MCF2944364.1 alpha/beta hydrolase [Paenibacillus tarimensis]